MLTIVGLNHYSSNYVAAKPVTYPSSGPDNDQGGYATKTGTDGKLNGLQAASSWYH
jgi:hypothetical protein